MIASCQLGAHSPDLKDRVNMSSSSFKAKKPSAGILYSVSLCGNDTKY